MRRSGILFHASLTATVFATVLASVLAGPGDAAAAAAADRTPEALLADYEKALGGSEAWSHHKAVHVTRQVSAKAMQLRGTEEQFQTAAGKAISITTLPGLGTFKQGSTGKAQWTEDPINGLRVLSGAEADEMRLESTWNADIQLSKVYGKMRSVPPPVPAKPGSAHECLELGLTLAHPVTLCFDTKTHLRTLQKGVHATPQGDVPYTAVFSDWRKVGGMMVSFLQEQTAGPMTLEVRTEEILLDPPIADSIFAMPRAATPGRPARKPGKPTANTNTAPAK